MLKSTDSEKNCLYIYIIKIYCYIHWSHKNILLIVYEDITDPVIYWDVMLF